MTFFLEDAAVTSICDLFAQHTPVSILPDLSIPCDSHCEKIAQKQLEGFNQRQPKKSKEMP